MEKKLIDLIEDQINKELASAYIYYDIARYYKANSLNGFYSWFEKQTKEEVEHAEKFMNYLHDLGIEFKMKAIEAPNKEFKSFRDPLVLQVEHEAYVTSLIHNLFKEARKADDIALLHFLTWYVDEQVEEEANAAELLAKYDMFAKDGGIGLYEMDKDMGKR